MSTSNDSGFICSRNIRRLEPSATLAVTQEASRRRAAGEDIIDLSAGEPDFDTPRIVSDGAIRAIQEGKTHYPPNPGILDLRAAAASHLSVLSGGRPINADNIVVSTGAQQALFNTCFTLFGPHDSVLIPTPAWVSYPPMIHLARANPVMVSGDPEFSLKVSVESLEEASDVNTRGLLLCSPNNPTGAVYTLSELRAIAEWAKSRKLWLISDEIYRRIHYAPGPAPSVLDLPDDLLLPTGAEHVQDTVFVSDQEVLAEQQQGAPDRSVGVVHPHAATGLCVQAMDSTVQVGGEQESVTRDRRRNRPAGCFRFFSKQRNGGRRTGRIPGKPRHLRRVPADRLLARISVWPTHPQSTSMGCLGAK